MRRLWPLLLFAIIAAVVIIRPSQEPQVPHKDKSASFQRIISLAPSITETLFALGLDEKIVGVTDFCDYPPAASSLPKVGGYIDTNLEAVVKLQPDLVIMLKGQQKLQQQLSQLGIRTFMVDDTRLTNIQNSIASIGELTQHQRQATALLEHIQQQIDVVQAKIKDLTKPRVMVSIAHYVNSDQIDTVYIAGQHDFYNDLIKLAGGENVYTRSELMVPSLSAEGVIQLNPDVIIDVFPEPDDHNSDMKQVMQQWLSLQQVAAVKNGRVHLIEKDYASIPGPRIFNLLEDFAKLLHPEVDWNTSEK